MTDAHRHAVLAKVHIAKKDLGLDDDTYRDVIERVTKGRTRSSKDMQNHELHDLLVEFKAKGWVPKAATLGRGAAKDPQSRMVRGLWIELANAGVVRDRSENALRGYVKRITSLEDLKFCDGREKHQLIEALKAWGAREGVEFER
jgi:phage gp16-like protein